MTIYSVKTPPQHGPWKDFLDVWRAADDIDTFGTAWNFDHFYPLVGDTDGPCLEGWTMLAALAQATRRIRIGTMVNGMHYRHPAVTANMAATVDHISDGRLNLGLGAGWNEQESTAYGIELGSVKDRLDRFEEGVACIIGLLRDEYTNHQGRFFSLTAARCEPKPVQRPYPPIVLGGSGPKRTLAIVARYADRWDGGFAAEPAAWRERSDILDGHCADIGRDPGEIRRSAHMSWAPADDPSKLADRAAELADAGVDEVIFSMRGPYRADLLEPLANAITSRG
ncbi:MAG: TIGR03560 family F420-dependent LLM class oxidoreductase [Acidimicrobiales bacterium]